TKKHGGITYTRMRTTKTRTVPIPGTYTFTVTNAAGCISTSSGNVVINVAPSSPTAPVVGTITQPTCSVATGSVVLSGLPSTGTRSEERRVGEESRTGTETTQNITG